MEPLGSTDPKQCIYTFFTSYGRELVRGDEDAGVVVDRYHTPDIVQIADGQRMNREQLTPDGRMRRAHMLTRTLPDEPERTGV